MAVRRAQTRVQPLCGRGRPEAESQGQSHHRGRSLTSLRTPRCDDRAEPCPSTRASDLWTSTLKFILRSCDSQGQGTARRSRAVWPCGGSPPVSAGAVAGPAVLGLASAAGDGGRRRPADSRQTESSLLRTFAYCERSPTTNVRLLRTFAVGLCTTCSAWQCAHAMAMALSPQPL